MDLIYDYSRLAEELEKQELQSIAGIASPQVYGQLLAIYLLTNDLPNAKLLWKRIPSNIKSENSELAAVWSVGVKLWNRDFASIYSALTDFHWPGHLNNVMNCIKESTRTRAINLIAKGYTSISLEDVVKYIGLPVEETIKTVENLGWDIDKTNGFVFPTKTSQSNDEVATSEENLGKLTEYVAFLEN